MWISRRVFVYVIVSLCACVHLFVSVLILVWVCVCMLGLDCVLVSLCACVSVYLCVGGCGCICHCVSLSVCVHPTPWPFCLSVCLYQCPAESETNNSSKEIIISMSALHRIWNHSSSLFSVSYLKNLFEKRELLSGMKNTLGCFPRSGCLIFHSAPFYIGNWIFHLSLELRTKFWKTSLKVA